MNNVFDYARNKIKKQYQNNKDGNEKNACLERCYLNKIDFCEEQSKKGFMSAITCRFDAFKYSLNSDEKFFLFVALIAFAFVIYVFILGVDKTPLNLLFLNCADCFFDYITVMTIYFIYRLVRKRIIKNHLFYIVWALFFVLSIPRIPVLFGHQTTQIGDFYEAKEYTEKYYVIMSREPENVQNRKQYTLPATIERRKDYSYTTEMSEDYYFQEHGGDDVYVLNYHITHLYFPNGGYLVFDYDEALEDSELTDIELNKETEVIDYHGDYYYITLTNKKVSE